MLRKASRIAELEATVTEIRAELADVRATAERAEGKVDAAVRSIRTGSGNPLNDPNWHSDWSNL